jgi:hypothetical protein
MNDLRALQRAFQRSVLEHDADILAVIAETEQVAATTRIEIYRDAYRLRLTDALGSNYPRLRQLIGEDAFASLAEGYIDAHPSRYASVRWIGDALGSELAHSLPSKPWLAELARWEWAIAAAFDAPDVRPLSLDCMKQFASEDWPQLRFEFHPSLQKLRMQTNAPALFKALSEEREAPASARTEGAGGEWIIWRQEITPCYRSLDASEAAALETLLENGTFESMCTALCDWHTAEEASLQAARLLRCWFDEELVCNVVL